MTSPLSSRRLGINTPHTPPKVRINASIPLSSIAPALYILWPDSIDTQERSSYTLLCEKLTFIKLYIRRK